MKARKTIEVEKLKEMANRALLADHVTHQAKIAWCCMIEDVLFETGNYNGFRFICDNPETVNVDDDCYYNRHYF
jgi:hypothetical protein